MSDDEYPAGIGSPYSDLEDLLWDADPAPDLADDLASHALYSPTFADDPGYELVDYHSDWEYYSDDYYDDDPVILKHNPQDGSPIAKQSAPRSEEKRGRKRKFIETDDIPELDLGERRHLRSCMKGTVWAEPIPERDNLYTASKSPKVALMKDWKKKFGHRTVQPKRTGKEALIQADESWANDMSLEDMGLMNERGNRMEHEGRQDADAPAEGEEWEGEEIDAADIETLKQLAEAMGPDEEVDVARLMKEAKQLVAVPKGMKRVDRTSPAAETLDLPLQPEKRRKTVKPMLPSPPASNGSIPAEVAESTAQPTSEVEVQTSKPSKPGDGGARKSSTSEGQFSKPAPRRKRKASMSPELDQSPQRSDTFAATAGGRAKRVASSVKKTSVESKQSSQIATTAAAERPRRNRKK